mmetsp:Transcript_18206/g.49957  ORF Transcript_18206/g.49957 Transcript_18206/m.49957 type:complete len:283 (+) Transcript_18206:122-970(+)
MSCIIGIRRCEPRRSQTARRGASVLERCGALVALAVVALDADSVFGFRTAKAWAAARCSVRAPTPRGDAVLVQTPLRATQNRLWRWALKASLDDMFQDSSRILRDQSTPPQEVAKAIHLLQEAATKGHLEAQNSLGLMYLMGQRGVPRDVQQATHWLERAASGGYIDSYYNLGVMNYRGDGVPVNKREAAKLFRKAAEGGHEPSMKRMADMLAAGDGIPQDRTLSAQWLVKMCQRGNRWDELMDAVQKGNLDRDTSDKLAGMIDSLRDKFSEMPDKGAAPQV